MSLASFSDIYIYRYIYIIDISKSSIIVAVNNTFVLYNANKTTCSGKNTFIRGLFLRVEGSLAEKMFKFSVSINS